jgi:predicted Zn finger-like uncharacterized protein
MALDTACPACGTRFRVVEDQLRMAAGRVRCGHCGEGFDARQHRVPEAVVAEAVVSEDAVDDRVEVPVEGPPEAPIEAPAEAAIEAPAEAAIEAAAEARVDSPVEAPVEAPVETPSEGPVEGPVEGPSQAPSEALADAPVEAAGDASAPPPVQALGDPGAQLPDAAPPEPAPAPVASAEPGEAAAEGTPAAASVAPRGSDSLDPPPPATSDTEPLPAFLRPPEARTGASASPRTRRAVAAGGIVLAAVLAFAVAVAQREALLLAWPASMPLVEALCRVAACRVEPPRALDRVTVEHSALVRAEGPPARVRLTVGVRNRAPIAVRAPAVKLTLTDTRGAVVLERMFAPGELGLASARLEPGAEQVLATVFAVEGVPPAGYTIDLLYP